MRQEFIDATRDNLDDIEIKLDQLDGGRSDAEEALIGIQRRVHNIKGQGATFGFPITGRVAHMMEDYLLNADGIRPENIADIRTYLNMMADLISTGESIAEGNPKSLLDSLPTGQQMTFSTQRIHDINVLLVMPPGLQRRLVAKELLSCGFRVMRAYDSLEALSIAMDIMPDMVFVNFDMSPFNGYELSNMFAAVDKLHDIHFVLLTSHEIGSDKLQGLPDNVSVVQKHKNFTESIAELLIHWGVFGNTPHKTTESLREISQHPKAASIGKLITNRSLKILVAEDNRLNQRIIKATIEAFGHRLEVAENGLLAVDAVKGGDFDLILMDVRMPEMNGPDATRVIRQLSGDKSKIPIIAVTADGTKEHRDEYLEAGMDDCVSKPIDRVELLEAINIVMGEEIHQRIDIDAPESVPKPTKETSNDDQDGASGKSSVDIENLLKEMEDVADKLDKEK